MSQGIGVLDHAKRISQFLAQITSPVNTDGARPVPSLLAQNIDNLEQIIQRGPAFTLTDLPAYADAARNLNGVGLDDRDFLLERMLTLMSRLPDDSDFAYKLQQIVIDILYKDLPHPPSGYLAIPVQSTAPVQSIGKPVTYAFRNADGSNYNILAPSFGKAGMPYARSVPSFNPTPPAFLPDPGLVFDTLLKRDEVVPHPGGISSLFFAFADLVIHSIFNTDYADPTINKSSSYLDLSPLYGSSDKQVDAVRRKDGTGRLFEDVFADNRLLFMPPSVCALLVLFCRNHNYIADKLLRINEFGTYCSPTSLSPADLQKQDDEIFHRARLVNCGWFVQIILGDYVGAILGLTRDGSRWRLNPLEIMRRVSHDFAPVGEGNVVSVEFNILYRWHATLSAADATWMEGLFSELFPGKDVNTLDAKDLKEAMHKTARANPDLKAWTFDNLKRGADGRFKDDDLANILHNATETPASAFKARGIPSVLRVIEVLGMEQARSWGTCSLNEFRKFMGLKPYSNFEEWNPDPKIHTAAAALYHDIENLELHPGLLAEETKKPMPGAGLCPGYTISRAILADAVALTRGDRFFTVDFTPFNLTAWGYQDCQFDADDGSFNGMLPKLLFRTLPEHYPLGSAYSHFPFMVPQTMESYLEDLPVSDFEYTFDRPKKSTAVVVKMATDIVAVLHDKTHFEAPHITKLSQIARNDITDRKVVHHTVFGESQIQQWAQSFEQITQCLIDSKAIDQVGSTIKTIDIVRDVINLVPVYWIANETVGLPLKTFGNPSGEYRDLELAEAFADVSNYVYLNSSSVHEWALRANAVRGADLVQRHITKHFARLVDGPLSGNGFTDSVIKNMAGSNECSDSFLKTLLAAGKDCNREWLASGLFAEVVASAGLWSRAITNIVEYWLEGSRLSHITEVVNSDSPESDMRIMECVREALKHEPPVKRVARTVKASTTVPSVGHLEKGDVVIIDIAGAEKHHSPNDTKLKEMHSLVAEEHGLLNTRFLEKTACQTIRCIFGLTGLKRGPGNSGQLNRYTEEVYGIAESMYLGSNGRQTPLPVSMIVQFSSGS